MWQLLLEMLDHIIDAVCSTLCIFPQTKVIITAQIAKYRIQPEAQIPPGAVLQHRSVILYIHNSITYQTAVEKKQLHLITD